MQILAVVHPDVEKKFQEHDLVAAREKAAEMKKFGFGVSIPAETTTSRSVVTPPVPPPLPVPDVPRPSTPIQPNKRGVYVP